ncbi:MAG TPA: lipoyl(octanoyl) transferase LipB [Candidatus Acidoferrales bacterium]
MQLGKETNSLNQTCAVVDLGLISHSSAYELQQRVVAARKAREIGDVLLFCEHPHVITQGRNGKPEHLRASAHLLDQMNVEFHETDRGGDITYHGPGQIVGYPIIDLTAHRRDVRWYVQQLEEVMIQTSAEYGVEAARIEGQHGIWVRTTDDADEKLAAIGVHLSRWVTSHGFAYNVSTDLRYFDLIVPCGISGKRATCLERILGRVAQSAAVKANLTQSFGRVFDREMISMSSRELESQLARLSSSSSGPPASVAPEITGQIEFTNAGVPSGH